jgi:S1-C subfamily serine protease
MLARLGLCVLIMVCPLAVAAADSANIPALVQKTKPAVVEILTFDQQNKLLKTGTGFFISSDGVLLTNYHVISGGSSYLAKTPTGSVYFFKGVVAIFEPMDIAKLQFFTTEVSYLTLGRSFDAVEGQRVLVIGNPEGLEGTVSDGIISAFRDKRTLIQITAPVSPGSSGSPVLDESGAVIGMATQMYKDGQNLNFAVASEAIAIALTAVEQAQAESRPSPSPTPFSPSQYTIVSPTPSPRPTMEAESVDDWIAQQTNHLPPKTELARVERNLNTVYTELQSVMNEADKKSLKEEETAWLAKRAKVRNNPNALYEMTNSRISVLLGMLRARER